MSMHWVNMLMALGGGVLLLLHASLGLLAAHSASIARRVADGYIDAHFAPYFLDGPHGPPVPCTRLQWEKQVGLRARVEKITHPALIQAVCLFIIVLAAAVFFDSVWILAANIYVVSVCLQQYRVAAKQRLDEARLMEYGFTMGLPAADMVALEITLMTLAMGQAQEQWDQLKKKLSPANQKAALRCLLSAVLRHARHGPAAPAIALLGQWGAPCDHHAIHCLAAGFSSPRAPTATLLAGHHTAPPQSPHPYHLHHELVGVPGDLDATLSHLAAIPGFDIDTPDIHTGLTALAELVLAVSGPSRPGDDPVAQEAALPVFVAHGASMSKAMSLAAPRMGPWGLDRSPFLLDYMAGQSGNALRAQTPPATGPVRGQPRM